MPGMWFIMKLTVVYDNEARTGLRSGWGFSCLVEVPGHRILFDTGWDGHLLLDNMRKLSISPADIDTLVLSHQHWDHIGGLPALLNSSPDLHIYVPSGFSSNLKKEISSRCAILHEVKDPRNICESVYTTGELGTDIKEQSLVLDSAKGLYVIAGCAHPGISSILSATSRFGTVAGIIGGLHDTQEHCLLKGLQLIGAGHCTVHKNKFREMYPGSFKDIFAGYSMDL